MNHHQNEGAPSMKALFYAVWPKLQLIEPNIQLLGGFALLLKQEWLRDTKTTSALPMERWSGELQPRTTKDMDVGVRACMIADVTCQEQLQLRLDEWQFCPGEKNWQKRWAWEHKPTGIMLEFSSTMPDEELHKVLKIEDGRVKNRLLRGAGRGIHGHVNAELVGFEYSFSFEHEGIKLSIPNVITAAMMKLTAFDDRRTEYEADPKVKALQLEQYEKHARDVFRIVAMMTSKEAETIPSIHQSVAGSELFQKCQEIIRTHFLQPRQVGYEAASGFWRPDEFALLVGGLKALFCL